MYLAAYGACGVAVIDPMPVDPLADRGHRLDRQLTDAASTVAEHLTGCGRCQLAGVRMTVWSRGRLVAEATFDRDWFCERHRPVTVG